MKSLLMDFHLYRSNPIIMRQVAVPNNFPLGDLCELCCIIFDIDSSKSTYELIMDNAQKTDECLQTPDALPGMAGTIHLEDSSAKSNIFSLDIHFRISECEDGSVSHPVLKSWTGYQIPKNCFNTASINSMQSVLGLRDSWQSPTGDMLYKDSLWCNPDKVNNSLCRRYAPDQVKPEVRSDIRIPVRDLLETVNLSRLKAAVQEYGAWRYCAGKKANYVACLTETFEERGVDYIFGEMEMDEYLRFYQLVINGNSSCQCEDDVIEQFPVLYRYFRICYLKKQGIRIASDLLTNYEKWFDKPKEAEFRRNKKICQGMRWCLFTYAIFSVEDCYRVLEAVYPGEVSLEDLQKYWIAVPYFATPEYLSFARVGTMGASLKDYAFDKRIISLSEAMDFMAVEREDHSEKKLPSSAEEFEATAIKGLDFSAHELQPQELNSVFDRWSDTPDSVFERADYGVGLLRREMSPEDAARNIVSKYERWSYSADEKTRAYTAYLSRVENDIPLFLYYGFTRKEVRARKIESVMLEKYTELQKKRAEEKRAGRKYQQTEPRPIYSSGRRK